LLFSGAAYCQRVRAQLRLLCVCVAKQIDPFFRVHPADEYHARPLRGGQEIRAQKFRLDGRVDDARFFARKCGLGAERILKGVGNADDEIA